MLNRRLFVGGLSASLPLIVLPGAGRAQAGRPRLHAMVVGINHYLDPIKSLHGCINDARDIEAQVRRLDPRVRVLLGETPGRPVRRAAFFSAWQSMMAEAQKGDTLLVTFSGHGTQIPAGNPSNEADGRDETLVLSEYTPDQPRDRAEHIIDDEIDRLARDADARGLILVFVADCCHSGGVYRAVELPGVSYRTVRPNLPPGPERSGPPAVQPESPPNLLFLAGSQENELVPEITVGGQHRGALSVAVARALEGQAARDGVITAFGFTEFVFRHVESLSDAGQHPDVTWPTTREVRRVDRNTPIVVLGQVRDRDRDRPPAQIGPVRLRIHGLPAGEQQKIQPSLRNAVLVGEQEAASLIWDAGRRLILNDQRQKIAEEVGASHLQHAIDRRLALERLIGMSAANGLNVRFRLPGEAPDAPPSVASDASHKPGTTFDVVIGGVRDSHYCALFNLTGNGKVQMLEPYPGEPPNFAPPDFRNGIRKQRGASTVDIKGVVVQKQGPFGAEHVVAVAGALPLHRLMPALKEAHEKFAVAGAMAGLAREAEVQPLQIGFRGIYSARP